MTTRSYVRVANFELKQSPKRPKRPSWIRSFCADLDDIEYRNLSLTSRGFLADFEKLAAGLDNCVADDTRFIGQKLGAPPRVVGKALHACIQRGFITRFDKDIKLRENINLDEKIATRPIPPSYSQSTSTPRLDRTTDNREAFREIDDLDIPF